MGWVPQPGSYENGAAKAAPFLRAQYIKALITIKQIAYAAKQCR